MEAGRGEDGGERSTDVDAVEGAAGDRTIRPPRIKAWANMFLRDKPADLAASAGGRAALYEAAHEAIAAGDTTISWGESWPDRDGYMDAYARGDAADMAPLLEALGERGFSYGVDVDVAREDDEGEERPQEEVDAEFESVVELCGEGVAYAEAYDVA